MENQANVNVDPVEVEIGAQGIECELPVDIEASVITIANLGKVGEVHQVTRKNVMQFKIRLKHVEPPIWRRIQVSESYKFWGLHVALQNVFSWADKHLHRFQVINPNTGQFVLIGKPLDTEEPWSTDEETARKNWSHSLMHQLNHPQELGKLALVPTTSSNKSQGGALKNVKPEKVFASWEVPLKKYYSDSKKNIITEYKYNFDNDWTFDILFEGMIPAQTGLKYPICLDGQRTSPPEDCHGPFGYLELLENLVKIPAERTEEEVEMIEWLTKNVGVVEYNAELFEPSDVEFANEKRWLRHRRANTVLTQVRDIEAALKNTSLDLDNFVLHVL